MSPDNVQYIAQDTNASQVEEIVPIGSLDTEAVHLPGIYVDRVFKGQNYEKRIEVKITFSYLHRQG